MPSTPGTPSPVEGAQAAVREPSASHHPGRGRLHQGSMLERVSRHPVGVEQLAGVPGGLVVFVAVIQCLVARGCIAISEY